MTKKNVYIGCGSDIRKGFIHTDIKKMPHINYICNPWELSQYILEIDYIYSKNMLQYLTNYEADRTLRDCFKSLKSGGTIKIIVPNINFYCKQLLEAEWTEDTLRDKRSPAQNSFRHIWGIQENSDPWSDTYNTNYFNIHKSGYNQKRLYLLLDRINFDKISIELKNEEELIATATKPKYSGERQVGTTLDEIRVDHLKRYEFASKFITKDNAIVTDGACGVGYGSYLLAQNIKTKEIQSLDISQEAINHAKQYFNNEKIKYTLINLEDSQLPANKPDYFISFETIEHLPTPEKYIEKVSKNIKDDGVFIGSTPNEEIMPFIQQNFLYHTRHFTVNDLKKILTKHGFREIDFFQQKRQEPSNILDIKDGQYIIFVAKK